MAKARYSQFEVKGRIEDIIDALKQMKKFYWRFEKYYEYEDRNILAVLIGRRPYFLGSFITASIILRAEDHLIAMEVIGFNDPFQWDWGKNKKIVYDIYSHLTDQGFKITEIYFTELPEDKDATGKEYPCIEPLFPTIK